MSAPISDNALDVIFRQARSYNAWQDKPVPETLVRAIYDLHRWGPTSANCSPARYVFLPKGSEGREKLVPLMIGPNQEKTRSAAWTVIIAYDHEFHEKIPRLFPHNPGAREWFSDEPARTQTAFRNGTLQSAYFLMAARALGLDCGPLSGFDMDGVNATFFEGAQGEMRHWRANWICNLGYGSQENLFERSPRLDFEEAVVIL